MLFRLFFYSMVGVFFRKDIRKITYEPSESGRYRLGLGSELTFLEVKNRLDNERWFSFSFKDWINMKRIKFGIDLTRGNFSSWVNLNLFRIYFLEDTAIGHKEEKASNLHIETINLNFLNWLKKRCDYSNHVWK